MSKAKAPKSPKARTGIAIHCAHTATQPAGEFKPHPRNWRNHPARQLRLFAKIIQAHGWRRAVVVSKRSGFIVKGHGAVAAALAHHLGPVPYEIQPYASEAEELADLTADNKLAEAAQTDEKKLDALLEALTDAGTDLELAGIDEILEEAEKAGDKRPASPDLSEHFQVMIECKDEHEQRKVFLRLEKEGLKCQLLTF